MNRPSGQPDFIPALHQGWLTPLYDPLVRWTMREDFFKPLLVRHAQIAPGHRVLDLGCGTATLTMLIKQVHPDSDVVGLDIDPQILAVARTKIDRAGLDIRLDRGTATELPYPDGSFDRVLTSLVLHHLPRESKARAAREVFRVLRPRGAFLVADFGPAHSLAMAAIVLVMRWFEETADHFAGRLPGMLREARFGDVEEFARVSTLFGPLSLIEGQKPQ